MDERPCHVHGRRSLLWQLCARPWLVRHTAHAQPWLLRARPWLLHAQPWLLRAQLWLLCARPWLLHAQPWLPRVLRGQMRACHERDAMAYPDQAKQGEQARWGKQPCDNHVTAKCNSHVTAM